MRSAQINVGASIVDLIGGIIRHPKPIRMTNMRQLADGDRTAAKRVARGDEIGDCPLVFKENLIKNDEMQAEQERAQRSRLSARRRSEAILRDIEKPLR